MAVEMVRIRVSMPRALVEEIDRRVGKKERSAFIAEAAAQELRRLRRIEALDEFAGSLKDVDIPGWEMSESAAEWVREQRRAWE
jgi:metal-responsive CopG/Arc/MetJ family transcriptional regulator